MTAEIFFENFVQKCLIPFLSMKLINQSMKRYGKFLDLPIGSSDFILVPSWYFLNMISDQRGECMRQNSLRMKVGDY